MNLSIYISWFLLILLASDCSAPFEYADNSRLVIEGRLLQSDGSTVTGQDVLLYTASSGSSVIIHQVTSDSQGNFYITSPKGNYPLVVEFKNKDFEVNARYTALKKLQNGRADILTNFSESYYNLGSIIVKPVQ